MPGINRIAAKREGTPRRASRASASKKTEPEDVHFLAKRLDEFLYTPQRESNGRGGRFSASAIGNPCDRFLYYHYHGKLPQQEIPGQLKRIFDHGNITQDRYKSYFQRMGIFLADEVEAKYANPPISGRADYVLRIVPEYMKFIVELKTIKASGFNKLVAPKPEHEVQLRVYLMLLDVLNGAVLYECKDNQKVKSFHVTHDAKIWDDLIARLTRIQDMTEAPSFPEKHDYYCNCLMVR